MPADSVAKARTPEPLGKGGRNWITKLRPGNRGELPPYVQHIAKALMTKRGMPKDRAYAIAVSAPKRWLRSRHSDAGTKAASAIATGEWEKDRALNRLRKVGRAVATQAAEVMPTVSDTEAIFEAERETLEAIEESVGADVLEAAVGRVVWVDGLPLSPREHALDELAERAAEALTIVEATRSRTREIGTGKFTNYLKRISDAPAATTCSKCGALKLPDKMCPSCEAPTAGKKAMSLAEAAAWVIEEAELDTKARKALPKSAFAIPEKAPGSGSYPIHDRKHAIDALARSSGKPEEARVKAAVYKRYPDLKEKAQEDEQLAEATMSHADLTARVAKMKPRDRIHVGGFQVVKHGTLGHGHHSIHDADGKQVGDTIASPSDAARAVLRHAKKGKLSEAAPRMGSERAAGEHMSKAMGVLNAGGGTKALHKHLDAASKELPRFHPSQDELRRVRRAGVRDKVQAKRHLRVAKDELTHLNEAEIDGAKPTGHAGALGRVKSLKLGETARLPEGLAVTHSATPDGRKVWRADTPSRWASSGWSLGDEHRTPEDAVKDAFGKSAASKDPASLGGATRYHSYSRVSVGGKEHRFLGVDPHSAKPEVRDISGTGQPGSVKTVAWSELHPVDDIMQQGDGGGVLGSMLDTRLEERARARRDTIASIAGARGPKDTMDFHAPGGKFSKGRANIHAQMARHVLDNPRAHNSGPVAMVATRSPSGGAVHTVKGAGSAIPHDAVHISISAMRERIPEHAALAAHASADEHKTTDREARHVAKLAATVGLMRGKSVVIHDDPDSGDRAAELAKTATRHAGAMRRAARGA